MNAIRSSVRSHFAAGLLFLAGIAWIAPVAAGPLAFGFAPVTDAMPEEHVESAAIVVQGIDVGVPIAVVGGEYSLNGGDWTSAPGSVELGAEIKLRLETPDAYGATVGVGVTIGGVGATFAVSTRTYQPVTAAMQVFVNPQTAEVNDQGIVRFRAAPAEVLVLAADAVENAVVRSEENLGIAVVAFGNGLLYTAESSDTRFQVRSIAGAKNLEVIGKSARILAPVAGSVIPALGAGGMSFTLVTQVADTRVTIGRNDSRELEIAVDAGSVRLIQSGTGQVSADGVLVYAGETVNVSSAGVLNRVRFGSLAQNLIQAGDYIAAIPLAVLTLKVPRVAGLVPRFGEALDQRVARALAGSLGLSSAGAVLTQDAITGIMTLATAQGSYRYLPVGALGVDTAALTRRPTRAAAGANVAANLTAIVAEGLSFAVAPAMSYQELDLLLKQIDPAALVEILADGAVGATLLGSRFVAQPDPHLVPGGVPGPGLDSENGALVLRDVAGNRQTLLPAFANTDYLATTFASALPGLAVANAGAGRYVARQAGASFALTPEIALSLPPVAQAGNLWWVDGASGKYYIRYGNGFCQAFGVQ